jgi:hypothetical protein
MNDYKLLFIKSSAINKILKQIFIFIEYAIFETPSKKYICSKR